jgi:hypothetical protein
MTNKVIEQLEEEGLVSVGHIDGRYEIRITKAGVLYLRKYNEFYLRKYEDQIRDHYRYKGLPHWVQPGGK